MSSRRWRYVLGSRPFPNSIIFLASSLAEVLTALIALIARWSMNRILRIPYSHAYLFMYIDSLR